MHPLAPLRALSALAMTLIAAPLVTPAAAYDLVVDGGASHVRLDIYDTAGRLVGAVADGEFAAGEHSAEWTGEDRSGGRVNAGVYFVRLEAGSFKATRRLTFLR